MKRKKWYSGNKGAKASRVKREASLAGEHNPKCEVVICKGCGADTTDPTMLCDKCKR